MQIPRTGRIIAVHLSTLFRTISIAMVMLLLKLKRDLSASFLLHSSSKRRVGSSAERSGSVGGLQLANLRRHICLLSNFN